MASETAKNGSGRVSRCCFRQKWPTPEGTHDASVRYDTADRLRLKAAFRQSTNLSAKTKKPPSIKLP
jgi:hypothetical protein